MKNLQRTFVMTLALIVVLGMSTVPVGAVPRFADENEIVHTDAVNRAVAKGLFVGANGKFMPKDTVTRAQMATIIVKIVYGSDFNADPHKGLGKFPDTAAFEGGWAEGYICLCAKDGFVKGYGDGTFQPGNKVNAAEAVTMLLNAMKVDAGQGEWPTTVMNKATEMGLFAALGQVESNTPLDRDRLAALVMAALDWQAKQQEQAQPGGTSSGGGGSSRPSGSVGGGSSRPSGSDTTKPQKPVEKEPVLGVEASKADLEAKNVFYFESAAQPDGSVKVTLSLKGAVELCGFDLLMLYDNKVFALRELDTEHDLTLYSHTDSEQGTVSFNYSGATNITKEKTLLTAVFDRIGQATDETVFSLKPVEVIKTDPDNGYAVGSAEYALTWCRSVP